ncbi:MAG: tRNA (adenosine(37)-N6)-threonylcarbamoyltransferase complex dimerization subunit type 1 TsaB [Alphaproteobacteria bacterium]|nr:tRNA (adenosine(37)-N6)-threonylcarbamoyltransferase complex dimerization subunit type 1 TsaB [Alphaproteobacteria bacterium]MDE2011932.1 tRNA (adenosine(37)-N6)-threonylcarbamoyltransferase complex dimerization subunit type 1 TsaB [Alphaproteobacteria bacterium]MDE2072499.1 tRNA (adenosine(37)-N6)-threonylcarbamoyltransferase complex dimerization subunit type 1 TsaB [Alphaproteobacteria bacterium]MDE2351118.1 tRNA (adenosine(37)-N6)-threonylcarbamoyltransferase complex dimerization subunit t
MKILAVDTALGACSVAVLDGETVLAHRFEPMERGHAEALAPMVEVAMTESGLPFAALERLAVTTGPGTFTGQRVGLAFMRGLRLALKLPLVGITTLAAMAHQAMAETGAKQAVALHDARRDEVYAEMIPGFAPSLLKRDDVVESVARAAGTGPLALAGTAAADFLAPLRVRKIDAALCPVRHPDALWVARLALAAPAPDGPPRPLYLRAPDARLPSAPAA